ncbi:DUF4139 domain-containing protein [Arenimonas sp.]|uniref:DUF4139 domain-containing protein n=1 Tax=Arenimonas sp. TaxID=1872635 RepID=UPI0035B28DCB
MKYHLLALATAAAISSPGVAADDTRLTIYSGDFDAVARSGGYPANAGHALVDATLAWDLKSGDNTVRYSRLPQALDASSVRLEPQGQARVRGQRYDFALADQDALLRRAIGQTVTVEQSVGNGLERHTGTLLAAGNGLTLQLPDGRVKVLSNYASFELPVLPEGLAAEPGLAWTINAPRAGRESFALSYATGGLAWRAEYQATLRGQGKACRMDFDGAAMVANTSGMDFSDVGLSLVAGQPNRVSDGGYAAPMAGKAERMMVVADAAPAPEASGEYHAYRLPGTGDLPTGSVQRLPLVDAASGVACERRFETRSPMGEWQPPQPMIDPNYNRQEGEQPVIANLHFENAKSAGLGLPLPAGRVRVFDGKDFLGEATLGHTPAQAKVSLALGTVFDITAERERADFQIDRSGRTMTETVVLTLRNAKDEAATVHVREVLSRWTDWEITDSSVPAKKLDAQAAGFEIAVPAGGETQLRYTVRYRWAPDVRLP